MGETSLRYSTDEEESISNCESIIVLCFQSIVNSNHHYSIVFSINAFYVSIIVSQSNSIIILQSLQSFFNHQYSNQELQSRIHVAFSVDQKATSFVKKIKLKKHPQVLKFSKVKKAPLAPWGVQNCRVPQLLQTISEIPEKYQSKKVVKCGLTLEMWDLSL